MHRVLISPQEVSGRTIAITAPGALRHLDAVRVRPGERIECVDGTGGVYRGTVSGRVHGRVEVAMTEQWSETPLRPRITLAAGLIRPERFDWLVQKATELGVAEIVPLYAARARGRPSVHGPAGRLARWRRIAAEATTQSGGAYVPTIAEPRALGDLLEQIDAQSALLFTLQADGARLGQLGETLRGQEALTLMIGPEGDFTVEEVAAARAKGARPVRLGPRILRSETAAVAALAIVQHLVEQE